jgi:hypothetical protein
MKHRRRIARILRSINILASEFGWRNPVVQAYIQELRELGFFSA